MKIKAIALSVAMLLVPGVAVAGRMGGSLSRVDMVKANTTDTYVLFFEGFSKGQITVRGDGSSDLDCYLYENERQVLSDADSTDTCFLSWFQFTSGKVTLKIKNRGDANVYRLETN